MAWAMIQPSAPLKNSFGHDGGRYQVRTTLRDRKREASLHASITSLTGSDAALSFVLADLTKDEGRDEAVAGCDHVIHIASPLGAGHARSRVALVEPAMGGALRVLRAALSARVGRVVMTSAAATARQRNSHAVSNETIWADPNDPILDPYRLSKILAKRAAWDFMKTVNGGTTLTTLLPGAVFGPLLPGGTPGSIWVIKNMLEGKPPHLVNLGLSVVDVRDQAAAHAEALIAPQAPESAFCAPDISSGCRKSHASCAMALGQTARRCRSR